jgi:hypothetical protein
VRQQIAYRALTCGAAEACNAAASSRGGHDTVGGCRAYGNSPGIGAVDRAQSARSSGVRAWCEASAEPS